MKHISAYITFILLFSCNLLLSCNSNTPKSVIDFKTDTAIATTAKGVCDVNHFMFFNKNSTIGTISDFLKKENISFENYAHKDEGTIRKKYFKDLTTDVDCPDAKFIVIPVLKFDQFTFNNVILVFYEGNLAQLILWEQQNTPEQRVTYECCSILFLKQLYEAKYGAGEYVGTPQSQYGELWCYKNNTDSISAVFKRTHYEHFNNYDIMSMSFEHSYSLLFHCAEISWIKEGKEADEKKKETDDKQKKVLDTI